MDPNKWLRDHVPGYAALSPQERRAIRDFSLLWSLYEGTRLNTQGSVGAIVNFTASLHIANRLAMQPAFRAAVLHFRNRYYTEPGFNHAFDSLHFRARDRRPLVESVLSGMVDDDASILTALLIIVYRLRNNLFHGQKWAYGITNQLDNFRHASNILIAVMTL